MRNEGVDVLVLGPVAVRRGGEVISPGSRLPRALLAVLALGGDAGVTDDLLLAQIWTGREAPRNPADQTAAARSALRVAVHRLRQWLDRVTDGVVRVDRTATGYVLAGAGTDLHRFRALVAAARRASGPAAVDALTTALGLWRGPAVADAGLPGVDDGTLGRLDREYRQAVLDYATALVSVGRSDAAVDALAPLAARHPLDEALQASWVETLAAAGRQTEALTAHRAVRDRLRAELGVDAGPRLREVLVNVLRQNAPVPGVPVPGLPVPGVPEPAGEPVARALGKGSGKRFDRLATKPAQLPAPPSVFRGRTAELRTLLDTPVGEGGLWTISGIAGVGKTALALHWAHQCADRFPDGQLYVDLHGFSPSPPVAARQALGALLRALGVDDRRDRPARDSTDSTDRAELDKAAARFRSATAGRRLLLLLDNAADVAQVRPLLPGEPRCVTVITSRNRLDGLVAIDGARPLHLGVLGTDAAAELLTELLTPERVAAEPGSARALAGACGGLPLALRIAAANLLTQPRRSIADYARELRDGEGWAELAVPGDARASVHAAFDLSYQRLSESARRLFRSLGSAPHRAVTPARAAQLTGCPVAAAEHDLGVLVAAGFVTELGGGRYACDGLPHRYARHLAGRPNLVAATDPQWTAVG